MRNFTILKIFTVLTFLLSGMQEVVAQKPTWTIPVIVYVDQATADVYGGAAGIEPKIKAQFLAVNQFYNNDNRFSGVMNFVPKTFKYFKDNATDDAKSDAIE